MNTDSTPIFISHSSQDDAFVNELRLALDARELEVWTDSRQLRGSDELWPELAKAIASARSFIVVFSTASFASGWVQRELQYALEIEKAKRDDGFRVIPLLLDDFPKGNLNWVFKEERIFINVRSQAGGVSESLQKILEALGEQLPTETQPPKPPSVQPVEELILKLTDPQIHEQGGKRRATATAELCYEPATAGVRGIVSDRFPITAPLGPIENEDLRWYLEEYAVWPGVPFQKRAADIAAKLPEWGKLLFEAATGNDSAKEALQEWQHADPQTERRFSVLVDSKLRTDANDEAKAIAAEAASMLLSLPWELMHDGRKHLFQDGKGVRVRRRLPNRHRQQARKHKLPIRILLVSPRPEQLGVAYLDHRVSARPLVEAVEALGDLVQLTVLSQPTYGALEAELQRATDAGEGYDVVHFDGHGVYDHRVGLGGLCFEAPKDSEKLEGRAMELIHAEKLAAIVSAQRIPLVFLEACQTAQAERVDASVAASLLNEGVASVVAMSHSVLVETARRFVTAFYQKLAEGSRVGTAMLAGQRALHADSYRGRLLGAGELRLQDWFVPVLYQEEDDVQLVPRTPSKEAQAIDAERRKFKEGALPAAPTHGFIGRSRELLSLERLLQRERYAVVRGIGGEGKTTLAVELARWLVRIRRFERAAFVSLEQYSDWRGVLDSVGRQLVGAQYSAAGLGMKEALKPVERALREQPTIIVLDNLESVLPPTRAHEEARIEETSAAVNVQGEVTHNADNLSEPSRDFVGGFSELFALFTALRDAEGATRLVFTSREPLPEPFANPRCDWRLRRLSGADAKELVAEVLKENGHALKYDDAGNDPQEVVELVEAVNCHARALTLLARELARGGGVRATTENMRYLMAEMHCHFPDNPEESLYACVERSINRLSGQVQHQIKGLCMSQGGVHILVLAQVTALDALVARQLGIRLIDAGLAEDLGDGHLRLHPALPYYLLRLMTKQEYEQASFRWMEGMQHLADYIHWQQFKNSEVSARLASLELPNLLLLLTWMCGKETPEKIVYLAAKIEQILSESGQQRELKEVIAIREEIALKLVGWSHASFESKRATIDRLVEQEAIRAAYLAAQELLGHSLDAGEQIYPEAAFDIAMAYCRLGSVLSAIGDMDNSLPLLTEALHRFLRLAEIDDSFARMVHVTIYEIGNCLKSVGLLNEAVSTYQIAINLSEKNEDKRAAAVSQGGLAYTYMLLERYNDALKIFARVRDFFIATGEPSSVAISWHNTGIVYRQAKQYQQAERAYKNSLAISMSNKYLESQASTLNELGALYSERKYLEYGLTFSKQAADIYTKLQNPQREGRARHNIAVSLGRLQRYDEARRELLRAIECKQPFGHAAQIWKTWDILHDLELAEGNAQAAAEARANAIAAYLAYRRARGESQANTTPLYALVYQAIAQDKTDEAAEELKQYARPDASAWLTRLLIHLHAILDGARDPAIADDPALNYADAVELQLLLESLQGR